MHVNNSINISQSQPSSTANILSTPFCSREQKRFAFSWKFHNGVLHLPVRRDLQLTFSFLVEQLRESFIKEAKLKCKLVAHPNVVTNVGYYLEQPLICLRELGRAGGVNGMRREWREWRLEGWRAGGLEGWRAGGLEGWRAGGRKGWRAGGLEGWRWRNAGGPGAGQLTIFQEMAKMPLS
jgi:hypothetical protein